eukprot:gene3436-2387_t
MTYPKTHHTHVTYPQPRSQQSTNQLRTTHNKSTNTIFAGNKSHNLNTKFRLQPTHLINIHSHAHPMSKIHQHSSAIVYYNKTTNKRNKLQLTTPNLKPPATTGHKSTTIQVIIQITSPMTHINNSNVTSTYSTTHAQCLHNKNLQLFVISRIQLSAKPYKSKRKTPLNKQSKTNPNRKQPYIQNRLQPAQIHKASTQYTTTTHNPHCAAYVNKYSIQTQQHTSLKLTRKYQIVSFQFPNTMKSNPNSYNTGTTHHHNQKAPQCNPIHYVEIQTITRKCNPQATQATTWRSSNINKYVQNLPESQIVSNAKSKITYCALLVKAEVSVYTAMQQPKIGAHPAPQ